MVYKYFKKVILNIQKLENKTVNSKTVNFDTYVFYIQLCYTLIVILLRIYATTALDLLMNEVIIYYSQTIYKIHWYIVNSNLSIAIDSWVTVNHNARTLITYVRQFTYPYQPVFLWIHIYKTICNTEIYTNW